MPPEHTNDLTLGLEKRPPEALQPCRVLGREHMLSPALQLFLCLHRCIPGTSRTGSLCGTAQVNPKPHSSLFLGRRSTLLFQHRAAPLCPSL